MKYYICIRDDDLNYYTAYEDLTLAYGELLGSVPVTFATIPFVHPSYEKMLQIQGENNEEKITALRRWEERANEKELSEYFKTMPIGENGELVAQIKKLVKNHKAEIALHGVQHRYYQDGAEMLYDHVSCFQIRDGKEYLEKVFSCPIRIFIPPSNAIDMRNAKNVCELDLRLLISGSIKRSGNLELVEEILTHPVELFNKIFRKSRERVARNRNGIQMMESVTYSSYMDFEGVYNKARTLLDSNHMLCIATHYNSLLNKEYRNKFHELIDRLKAEYEVQFVTASEYYQILKKHKYL